MYLTSTTCSPICSPNSDQTFLIDGDKLLATRFETGQVRHVMYTVIAVASLYEQLLAGPLFVPSFGWVDLRC